LQHKLQFLQQQVAEGPLERVLHLLLTQKLHQRAHKAVVLGVEEVVEHDLFQPHVMDELVPQLREQVLVPLAAVDLHGGQHLGL